MGAGATVELVTTSPPLPISACTRAVLGATVFHVEGRSVPWTLTDATWAREGLSLRNSNVASEATDATSSTSATVNTLTARDRLWRSTRPPCWRTVSIRSSCSGERRVVHV